MAVGVRYFEFDEAQHDKLQITEDPSVIFSIVKVARDQTRLNQGLSSLAPGGSEIRDPGNDVAADLPVSRKFYI